MASEVARRTVPSAMPRAAAVSATDRSWIEPQHDAAARPRGEPVEGAEHLVAIVDGEARVGLRGARARPPSGPRAAKASWTGRSGWLTAPGGCSGRGPRPASSAGARAAAPSWAASSARWRSPQIRELLLN